MIKQVVVGNFPLLLFSFGTFSLLFKKFLAVFLFLLQQSKDKFKVLSCSVLLWLYTAHISQSRISN
jgi:hypothetical protein